MAWCTKLTTSPADSFVKSLVMVAREIVDLAVLISIPLVWLQPWYLVANVIFVFWNFVLMG